MTVSPSITPWSNVASRVFSGIVLTVPGATSSVTYRVSGRAGSLTPVEAHSGRCTLAPASVSAFARSVANSLLEQLVGQARVRDAGLALERRGLVGADRVEPLVDLGVDARDEERGDRVDLRQVVSGSLGLLEPGEVGVDDLGVRSRLKIRVTLTEMPAADDRGDGGQAGLGRRDLDVHVRAVDLGPQLLGLRDRRVGVVGEVGRDLDRDAAVDAVRGVVDRPEDVGGVAHVVGGDLEDRLVGGSRRARRARATWPSYAWPLLMAPAKIVGFVVTPHDVARDDQVGRLPVMMRSRERSSSQMLTPCGDEGAVGVLMSSPLSGGSAAAGLACRLDDGFGGDAELLEQGLVVGRGAEVLDRDAPALVADDVAPGHGDAGLHRDAGA